VLFVCFLKFVDVVVVVVSLLLLLVVGGVVVVAAAAVVVVAWCWLLKLWLLKFIAKHLSLSDVCPSSFKYILHSRRNFHFYLQAEEVHRCNELR